MHNIGNSFSLPFKDPGWFSTFLVIGLIGLIPVVGWLNMTGWMLATLDNYRRGQARLPPGGFDYIGRGVNVFAVGLLYALAISVVIVLPLFLLILATSGASLSAHENGNLQAANPMFALFPLWGGGILVVSVAEYFFLPAVILQTERHGIGGGLNVMQVFAMATANWKNSLLAAVLVYAAYFIGGLGIYACCVGILVSYPYSIAVVAGILRYYEASFETAPATPPAAGPPTAPA